MSREHTCLPFEGCHGSGTHSDPTDSGSGWEVFCDCPAGQQLQFCLSSARFDAGRGDETHVCRLPPGHEGDHAEGDITWRDRP